MILSPVQMQLTSALCASHRITLALSPVPLYGKQVFSNMFGIVIRLTKFFQRPEASVEVSKYCALLLFLGLSVISNQAENQDQ